VRLNVAYAEGYVGSCTAALLGPRTVLTAGHCVTAHSGSERTGGTVHVFANEGTGRPLDFEVDLEWVISHPSYPTSGPPPSEAYDVALVGLREPVELPIAGAPWLRIARARPDHLAFMWLNGQMRDGAAAEQTAFHRVVQLGELSTDDSRHPYQLLAACTSTSRGCEIQQGDSGGPLFREIEGEDNDGVGGSTRPRIYGVVSRIGSYARLDPVADWILATYEAIEAGARDEMDEAGGDPSETDGGEDPLTASEEDAGSAGTDASSPTCEDNPTLEACNAAGCAWYSCAETCRATGTPIEEVCSPPASTTETPSACGTFPGGDTGDSCADTAPETWRCACSAIFGRPVSQVCRDGIWQTFETRPSDCGSCGGDYSPGCG
jgi:hypothetical protein